MKFLVFLASLVLFGCSSGGGSSSSGDNSSKPEQETSTISDCMMSLSSIILDSGDSCNLTEADAGLFSISPGLLSCNDQTLTYNGNQFSAGQGFSFNGLSMTCGAKE